jgi:glutamate formiminotransferase / formiminotetrahydrofolate cyclodeaminase
VKRDADAFASVSDAYKLPKEPADLAARRAETITRALLNAAEVPLETARASVEVAELAAFVAEKGNANAVTDAGVAALLAEAACKGAAFNVRVNVQALDDKTLGKKLLAEVGALVETATNLTARTTSLVEHALSG